MGKTFKKILNYILVFIVATISAVTQLQDDYRNFGIWVPNSKMVFSQPLVFPHYNVPSWDHGHTTFNTNPEEDRRIGEIRNTGINSDNVWFNDRSRGQVRKMNSDFGVEKEPIFVNSRDDSNKDIYNNVSRNYEISGHKQSESNFEVNKKEYNKDASENEYQSENDPSKMLSSRVAATWRDNFELTNNRRSEAGNRKIVTVIGKVKNGSEHYKSLENHRVEYSSSGPSGKQNNLRLSNIGHINSYSKTEHNDTVKETEKDWGLNYRNNYKFATNLSTNTHNDSSPWRQNIGNNRDARNHYKGLPWNSNTENESSRHQNTDKNQHNFQLERNQNKGFTLRSGISSGRGPLHIQNEDSRLESEKGESGDINARGGAREFKFNRHLGNSRFGDEAWYGDSKLQNMGIMGQKFEHDKHRENIWRPTSWTSTERPEYYITKFDKNVENRQDMGDSTWKDNSDSRNIQLPGVNGITIADDGSGGTWEEVTRLPPHRNRFADTKLQNDYQVNGNKYQYYSKNMYSSSTSNNDFNVSQIIDDVPIYEHGLHAGNKFGGKRWNSEYGPGMESFIDEEVDGEPIKNPKAGTRISTSAPTVVTTYTLPNGTRVVRLRRIVRYRRPEDEGEAKSFGDIAKNLVQKKLSKFLSLFTIIRFPNDPCITSSGLNGTCYHHLECRSLGGIASGICARGYGVCCYFESTCGAITRQNCSYFVNPGFPAPVTDMLACVLTLQKAHPDVSQIRLDFFDFELLGPTNGTCVEDQFIVTGQNANSIAPIICGSNTGQHMYVDVDNSNGPIRLNVLAMGGNLPRSFRIKMTQIKRGSPLEAPRNCLQYHRGPQGTIESFNYQIVPDSNLPMRPGYMNNLNYAICIRKEPGFCTITYTNIGPDGTSYPFQITNVDADGMLVIPPGQAGAEVFNCPDDYIVINGIRLCGERLNDASIQLDFTQNAPVTDTGNGPFIIPVRTNENTSGRGFRLDYQQNQCAA